MKRKRMLFGLIVTVLEMTIWGVRKALSLIGEAQTVEFRLDNFRGKKLRQLAKLIAEYTKSRPDVRIILTMRAKGQGGNRRMSVDQEYRFWKNLPKLLRELIDDPESNVYVDIGYILMSWSRSMEGCLPFSLEKTVLSHHYMDHTPPDAELKRQVEVMERVGALCTKIVTFAQTAADAERILALYAKNKTIKHLIAFAMGLFGEGSRFECLFKRNSAGSFFRIPGRKKGAPGQVEITRATVRLDVRRRVGLPN